MICATPVILAQDAVSVAAQLQFVIDWITTVQGVLAVILGLLVVIVAAAFDKLVPVLSGFLMYLSTFQLDPGLRAKSLIPVLQNIRIASKSISFVLLVVIVAFIPLYLKRLGGNRTVGPAAWWFLVFQVFYAFQLAVFAEDSLLKGVFGIVAMVLTFVVFANGLGRTMTDPDSVDARLKIIAWVSFGFIATNLLQLAIDPSGAIMGKRLAGIAGNAQMMGGITTILMVLNCYLFVATRSPGPLKWLALANVGLLSLLVLSTGSRTAALASLVGVLLMFRSQAGKFIIFALIIAVGYSVFAANFEESAGVTLDRLQLGENTRESGWAASWAIFVSSPIFGELPFMRPGDEPNGIESTFIRTLANMGIVGGFVLLMPVLFVVRDAIGAMRLRRIAPAYGRVCDLYLASCGALLVLNTFDGYAFGILTFPVVITYVLLALGSLIRAQCLVVDDVAQIDDEANLVSDFPGERRVEL